MSDDDDIEPGRSVSFFGANGWTSQTQGASSNQRSQNHGASTSQGSQNHVTSNNQRPQNHGASTSQMPRNNVAAATPSYQEQEAASQGPQSHLASGQVPENREFALNSIDLEQELERILEQKGVPLDQRQKL